MHHSPPLTRRRAVALAAAAPLALLSATASAQQTAVAPDAGSEPSANPTLTLARFSTSMSGPEIPSDLRDLFGLYTLDCVSTMLAGCVQPVHRDTRRALAQFAGRGNVAGIGEGGNLSLSAAVMLDGLAAADFEFEHVMASTHPSSTAFPAILGLAAQRDLSGQDLLAAMVVAYEIAARIGTASGPEVEEQRGFHNPGLNGTIASAAGCSRLLGADADTCASAMGLAASSSAGLMSYLDAGAMTKRMHPARSAQLGMESAMLAMAGVEGPRDVLESAHGFLHAFAPNPRPALLTEGLGSEWRCRRMIAKFSPAHARAQPWLEAINAARDRGDAWRAAELNAVVAEAPAAQLPRRQLERQPSTLVSAQYSIAYCIAVALCRDLRNPMRMSDSALSDAEVQRIAAMLQTSPRSASSPEVGSTLRLTLKGRQLEIGFTGYPGTPGSGAYASGIESKFMRTLAGLDIEEHVSVLHDAVRNVEGAHGPRRLRQALVAAGNAAVRKRGIA